MPDPSSSSIHPVNQRACGIDVGSEEHWVCVDPSLTPTPIRKFGAFTADLIALVDWLRELGVTTVALESTGVYWRELYVRLDEAGIAPVLADPRVTRNPRNRKTDMQDCRWIWELHRHGLLDGAFVPAAHVQQVRTFLRFRQARVEQASHALTELQRALSLMNIKLQHVVSDIGGVTGMRIIEAILQGERDPQVLAQLRHGRCRSDEATLAKALQGTWRPEHLFLLREAYDDFRHHRTAMDRCDQQLSALIATFPYQGDDHRDLPQKRSTGKNDFGFDATKASYLLAGIDLSGIDGIGSLTALNFLGEVGFDLRPWPSAAAFCCWLGLCPNPKRSGGKLLGHLPTSANRAARILRTAVLGLIRRTGPIADCFRRFAARKGCRFAITATAHKLARIIYAMFRDRTDFDRSRLVPTFSARAQRRFVDRLQHQARRLGFALVPAQLPTT